MPRLPPRNWPVPDQFFVEMESGMSDGGNVPSTNIQAPEKLQGQFRLPQLALELGGWDLALLSPFACSLLHALAK